MSTQDIILLYSKYSTQCNKILKKASSLSEVRMIAIDQKDIRKRVLQDKQLNVSIVPCILIVNTNGIIEKYEGMKAFEWINEYTNYQNDSKSSEPNVSFIEPPQQPPPQQYQQPPPPRQQQPPQQPPQPPQQQQLPIQPKYQEQKRQPQQYQQPQQKQIPQPRSDIKVPTVLANQSSKSLMQDRYQQQQRQEQDVKSGKTPVADLRFEAQSPPPQAIRSGQSLLEQAELLKRGREDSFKNHSK